MAFDPASEGAIPVSQGFDPTSEGAILANAAMQNDAMQNNDAILQAYIRGAVPGIGTASTLFNATNNAINPTNDPNNSQDLFNQGMGLPLNLAFMTAGAALPEISLPEELFGAAPALVRGLTNMGLRGTTNAALGGAQNAIESNDPSQSLGQKFSQGMSNAAPLAVGGEALGALPRAISGAAEWINPQKFAGKIAENIRNRAQEGLAEGKEAYAPVHEKYDDNWVTSTPEDYLGFTPEDRQYFKPMVNKAYRDFKAEPSFANLHNLQSQMGHYPELAPMRAEVNQKLESYLSQDPEMLGNYINGRNIMREKYYPYTDNDTLYNIATTQKPITNFDPAALTLALKKSPLLQNSAKAAIPFDHPLVNLSDKFAQRMNRAELARYALPAVSSAIGGALVDPALGSGLGALGGAAFGYLGSPIAAKLAQNPSLIKMMENMTRLKYAGLQAAMSPNQQ